MVLALAAALGLAGGLLAGSQPAASRTVTWADLAPLHSHARGARRNRGVLRRVRGEDAYRQPAAGARGGPRSSRLLRAAVDTLHEPAADRAGAQRQGAGRQPERGQPRRIPQGASGPRAADSTTSPRARRRAGAGARFTRAGLAPDLLPLARANDVSRSAETRSWRRCASTCGRCDSSTRRSSLPSARAPTPSPRSIAPVA